MPSTYKTIEMVSFCLVISYKHWQYRLNISTNETFNEIKNRIISTCGIDLSDKGYVLEIYNDSLEQYVVLTQRYLTELYKSLPVTPIQTLDARLSPQHLEGKSRY